MRLAPSLIAALLANICAAQTAPVITINFDGTFDGITAAGPLIGKLDGKPELVPGKSGLALKSGPSTGYVDYPADLLNRAAGTVEMWVQPVDWVPSDRTFHVFFDTHGEGALYLYKYYVGNRLLMLTSKDVAGPYFSNPFGLNWKPGEWHHIAGTWSNYGVRVYVDGKPATATATQGLLPPKLGPTFKIGDHPWHVARTTSSLIDEVRLYDRALSPAHIAAHARGDYGFLAPLSAANSLLKHELDPAKGEVAVEFSTGGADVPDADLRAKVGVVGKGQPLGDEPERKVVDGALTATLPLNVSQPAQHEVVVQVLQQGKQAFEMRREVTVPDIAAWQGNRLGLEDKVLPPWTPVKVEGSTVSVWGREYDFITTGGIRQITSGGQPLLAQPVFVGTEPGNGVDRPWSPLSLSVNTAGTRAALEADLLPPGLRMQATVEYDGLVWVELSGQPAAQQQSFSIDIALRPEVAMYRHRYHADWDTSKVTGLLPEGQGVIDHGRFIPYYWLGNNDRGLFWFCESDEFWPNGQSPDAVQVLRAPDGTVTLRLNILAEGQKLPDNWKFAFGLQATPVKPLPKGWRKWQLNPRPNAKASIIWPTPAADSLKHYGYPEAADPLRFKARVDALHQQGHSAVPYLCLSYLSTAAPEWPFFRKRWAMGPVETSADVAAYGAGFAMVSPVGRDYADFIVWKTAQFINEYGIDGLYHDNTAPLSSTNLDAGCGYQRDGKVYPTYPILGYRALYRRMYAVLKSAPRETFSIAHMSGKVTIPILAYEDGYLDGEQFQPRVKDSYMDVMRLDTFRAEFMGRQWGVVPYFLPAFDAEQAAQGAPTRGLMALLMLHDTAIWPIWCNIAVANQALTALDEFGYVDAEFTGYFDTRPPAATDMQDVYVSAYRSGGRTLLIVGNVGREDRQGSVELNAAYFAGTLPAKALDWPAKTPLPVTHGKLSLAVPGLGYRLIVVE